MAVDVFHRCASSDLCGEGGKTVAAVTAVTAASCGGRGNLGRAASRKVGRMVKREVGESGGREVGRAGSAGRQVVVRLHFVGKGLSYFDWHRVSYLSVVELKFTLQTQDGLLVVKGSV